MGARNNRIFLRHDGFETTRKPTFFEQLAQVAGTSLRCSVARFRVPRSHQKEPWSDLHSRRMTFDDPAFDDT